MDYEPEKRPSVDTVLDRLQKLAESDNIAADLDAGELEHIASRVKEEFDIDVASRREWEETAKKSMEAALQAKEMKNFPFKRASNVKWPLITTAALQFNARAYPAIVSEDGIVKGTVVGDDPDGRKREKADRIGEHMSYQLREEMDGWEEDMDTLLIQLPIVGDVVKKAYRGPDGNVSEMIAAVDFVVHNRTKSLRKCPRMTHVLKLYPHEIEERRADGRFLDIDLQLAGEADNDNQAPHEFLEQHRRIDLDKDGYGEPYIITLHKDSGTVVRIVANFRPEDVIANDKRVTRIATRHYFVNFVFIPDPKGGFYGIGFGSLLEALSGSIDTAINQLIDAGTLQNAGGGFVGSGVRFKKGIIRQELGVWQTVDTPGAKLREAMVPHEHPGPSPVLFQLLGLLMEAATDITNVKDIFTGDTGGRNQTATTTLALIEQGMKVFTAIYKRVYRALRQEFKILFELNAQYLDDAAYFQVLDSQKAIAREDYDASAYDVCPVADPKLVTDMQRLARAQAILETAPLNPQAVPEILRRYYLAIGVEDVEMLLPQPDPQQAQMASLAAEMELRGKAAEIDKTQSETDKNRADIERAGMEAEFKTAELFLKGADVSARLGDAGQEQQEAA